MGVPRGPDGSRVRHVRAVPPPELADRRRLVRARRAGDSLTRIDSFENPLFDYCSGPGITFTRSRAWRKNNNCFVEHKNENCFEEQKNCTVIRQAVG
jgi:hypothetical protein